MGKGHVVLFLGLAFAIAAACGGNTGGDNNGSDASSQGDTTIIGFGDGFGGDSKGTLTISPANATFNLTYGMPSTFTYTASYNGSPVGATWSIDRGELASINGAGILTTTSTVGGKATISASANGVTATTTVTLVVAYVQNGAPASDAGTGTGGVGGVGGEGAGSAVSSSTLTTLGGTPTTDAGLAWLYPYDQTVWPKGLLAPLLQWAIGAQGDYDAIYIHAYEAAFDYKGYFSKTKTPFSHHPIAQAAWDGLMYSNGGEMLQIDLVFAHGTSAYGPITEHWKVANGSLKGTVYYNSYGTALAKNYCCMYGTSNPFGGATLAIQEGATSPVLIAGSNGGTAQCRVCHSVSADGSTLITQHGDGYGASSEYALKTLLETPMSPTDSRFAFPALSPDGTFLFSNAAPLPGVNNTSPSALFQVPSGTPIAATGLPSGLRAACPAFSPDGKHVAFNYYAGPAGDGRSLAVMDFASNTFTTPLILDTPSSHPDLFPSFLPTNDAVVYEREVANDGEFGATRYGTEGELWWTPTAKGQPIRLDKLNGLGYVPTGPNNHANDAVLNYEPTVNPVPSGGYAWVVFTSRRLYGNIATVDPFWSDPRDHDISTTPTTKKLWVAAVDLNAMPGTDPSHPAFYLPAQELLAGNSRGYWVVDPCKPDGTTCSTGDECCGGFCEASPDGGLTCQTTSNGCAQEFDKCTTTADCCMGENLQCINGRCAQASPN